MESGYDGGMWSSEASTKKVRKRTKQITLSLAQSVAEESFTSPYLNVVAKLQLEQQFTRERF